MTHSIFYYVREPGTNQPIGCVCLVRDESATYGRGVSICSADDQFSKKTGRELAQRRAIHAVRGKRTSLPMRWLRKPYSATWERVNKMLDVLRAAEGDNKCEYDPVLTVFEAELVSSLEASLD